jgi:hypothetical protein
MSPNFDLPAVLSFMLQANLHHIIVIAQVLVEPGPEKIPNFAKYYITAAQAIQSNILSINQI